VTTKDSFIYIFSGDGKGKTTAALGQAIRARGHGWRVLIVQFIKEAPSGEVESLTKMGVEIFPMGLGFVGAAKDKRSFEEHQQEARRAFDFTRDKVRGGGYDLLILDEINVAVDLGLLEEKEVLKFLKERPKGLNVILTGRKAPKNLIKIANLVTEMKEIKHPFAQGEKSRSGLDY